MPEEEIKTYTFEEIFKHSAKDSLWLLIDNSVYDLTKFKEEHPGGPEPLLDWAGKEATEAFEDVGHSSDARALMKDYKIGELCEEERKSKDSKGAKTSSCFRSSYLLFPLGVALTALLAYQLYTHLRK